MVAAKEVVFPAQRDGTYLVLSKVIQMLVQPCLSQLKYYPNFLSHSPTYSGLTAEKVGIIIRVSYKTEIVSEVLRIRQLPFLGSAF